MGIKGKLDLWRPHINNGDIILTRGKKWLARAIQWADKAYFNHALLVNEVGNRLLSIEANAKGVDPTWLTSEILKCEDFCIVRPQAYQKEIDKAVEIVMDKAEQGIEYDKEMILRILIYRKLGINIAKLGKHNQDICSDFTAITYGKLLGLTCYEDQYTKEGFITPQDIIRFADPQQIMILANDLI